MIARATDVALYCYLTDNCHPERIGPLIGWLIIIGFCLFVIWMYRQGADRR